MRDVFPLLVDPLHAVGAVGAGTWHCLEEEAGDSQNQQNPLPTLTCTSDGPPALILHRFITS